MGFEERDDVKDLVQQATGLHTQARSYVVATDLQYQSSAGELKGIKAARKALDEKKKEILEPALATIAAVRKLFKGPEGALEEAERLIKIQLIKYQERLAEIEREEQRKLEVAAQKERDRLRSLETANLAKAQAAIERGDTKAMEKFEAKAEELGERAASVVAPVIQREAPKVAGISTRATYSAVVFDLKALVIAAAEGKVPLSYVLPNDKLLGSQARSLQMQFVCPGVRVIEGTTMAAGSR